MSRLWRVWMSPPGGASMTTSARRAPRSAVTTWRSCLTSRGVRLPSISTVWQSWGCSRSPTDAAPDAPARARAGASGAASVGDREQPQLCQTVEMEGSRTPRDVKHDRHVVTADRGALRADVVIDAPPGGLIQTRHSRDIRRGARGHLTSGPTRGGGMHSGRHDLHPYTEFLVDETPTLSSNVNVTRVEKGPG